MKADIIGISSTILHRNYVNEFVKEARDLGFSGQILVGGACLTQEHVKDINVIYCKDVFEVVEKTKNIINKRT